MNYGFIKNGRCVNVAVYADEQEAQEARDNYKLIEFDELVVLSDGYGIGDYYSEGVWRKTPVLTPEEIREKAYTEMIYKTDDSNLITWKNKAITVDQANKIYLEYSAEGSAKAAEIQILIIAAKEYIRELYPDIT